MAIKSRFLALESLFATIDSANHQLHDFMQYEMTALQRHEVRLCLVALNTIFVFLRGIEKSGVSDGK